MTARTRKKSLPIHPGHPNGERSALLVGGFVREGHAFQVIRPGYDAQGRRRANWTQVVYDGVPIWEHKRSAELTDVITHFDQLWHKAFGRNQTLVRKTLKMVCEARRQAWGDQESGVEPAPAVTVDGRPDGQVYTA